MNNKQVTKHKFILFILICLTSISPQSFSKETSSKATKERLVLMPLKVDESDKSLSGAMETALVEGLQKKYLIYSGEVVSKEAHKIFLKESRAPDKHECDEVKCMQKIAGAFQAELLATANVTKRDGGYFLSLTIQNIFDNFVIYSKSIPCDGCTSFQVVEKMKEISGSLDSIIPSSPKDSIPIATSTPVETSSLDVENLTYFPLLNFSDLLQT